MSTLGSRNGASEDKAMSYAQFSTSRSALVFAVSVVVYFSLLGVFYVFQLLLEPNGIEMPWGVKSVLLSLFLVAALAASFNSRRGRLYKEEWVLIIAGIILGASSILLGYLDVRVPLFLSLLIGVMLAGLVFFTVLRMWHEVLKFRSE